MAEAKLSPMMQQYSAIKDDYKDAILMYRLGDFYEMFFDDAILASRELELTLTGRNCGLEERAPMCGVPFHSVDQYIVRLVNNGHKVAICEQVEDPAEAKGISRLMFLEKRVLAARFEQVLGLLGQGGIEEQVYLLLQRLEASRRTSSLVGAVLNGNVNAVHEKIREFEQFAVACHHGAVLETEPVIC